MIKPAPTVDIDTERAAALAEQLRLTVSKLHRRLREEGNFGDLTHSQSKVLIRLERSGPATVTALAEAEGMRPQSMSGIVSALKAAGMIEGRPDPSDGRQTVLSLTDTCRRTVAAARAAKQDWLFRALQHQLTPAEQQGLAGAVALLDRLIEP
ncbi:MAG: MarR family transcriptional regulator [Devosia sp.]|uniref:MarR family winged helix-turn-helix transcriptional regulator n=1 Tax=Devosia sp. TaxID=1871048 RepID=UPI0026097884|nr:MarR family transcriptional regulator [Devosia sp.]MDB5527063.1 MarR family transcriptional regulator [Devosia sp.]